jgi:thiamine-monophosphate kinase
MSTLRQLGERELIRRLAPKLPTRADVILGAGDDCAIVRGGDGFDLLYTTDAVIEGRHFLAESTPELIGRKAAARALSDIAAMGGEPLHMLLNLVARGDEQLERIERAYDGLCRICASHGVSVIGGDTTSGALLELHIFLTGRVPAGRALLRRGAKIGDVIYVTGALGGSIRGKHFEFQPRLAEGRWLREGNWANCLIDVSDGLATDLRHIVVASDVSALIDATRIPVSQDVGQLESRRTPLDHALLDGEDFELLFTVSEGRQCDFEREWKKQSMLPVTAIGRIERGPPSIQIIDALGMTTELSDSGFEHFRG